MFYDIMTEKNIYENKGLIDYKDLLKSKCLR